MASTYLTRTLGAATNRKKFTLSVWFKRSKIDQQYIWQSFYSSNFGYRFGIYFNSDDTLHFKGVDGGSTHTFFGTNRKFRDTSGWYHLYVGVDSTQATEADRFKIYINGVQETSFSSSTYPNQNRDFALGVDGSINYLLYIGRYGNSSQNYFDGSMSHFHYVDGSVIAHTQFGSTDSTTGEWKINTSPTISSYGTAGFLILKDGMTITDQSPNSNNLTVGAGTLTKTEDCPSNVFATLNPLSTMIGGSYTFTNGNTTSEQDISRGAISTLGMTSGKFYAEAKFISTSGTNCIIGICGINNTSNQNPGFVASGYIYDQDGTKGNNDSNSSFGNTYTTGDIIGIAVDLDNLKIYFSKNGTWQNSGDPTSGSTGTGAAYTISAASSTPDGAYFFAWSDIHSTAKTSWNFGNGYFGTTAVSSAGTNASGNGIFEYDVPAGYTALSTKGLNL